LTFLLE